MIPLLIIVTGFIFVLGQYGAGDLAMEITLQINDNVFDPEIYQSLREELGLDKPVLVRFARFLAGAARGDFGRSYVLQGTPDVGRMMFAALPLSAQLAVAATAIIVLVGIPMGVLAAVSRNTIVDYVIVTVVTVLSSIPPFVLVPVSMFLLVVQFKIIPTVGMGWQGLFHRETILPAACLAVGPMLGVVRYTRASVSEVLSQEYVRAARARGLPEWQVVGKHVVKNAMTPVVTVLGLSTARLLSGSIFVESAFGYRGFGWVAIGAFRGGDIQTVAATTLVSALIVMLANLVVDLVYSVLDPRVRFGRK
jgi:ABC-type dipeptide/oligopeptide/nickel transport system permease component